MRRWTVLLLVSSWLAAEHAAATPNVIVILADDAGAGDFSFTGNTNLATPAIDRLAAAGARFDRFFVQPVCAPTRAELLTGRWHQRGGVRGVSLGLERLDPAERTMAEVFHDAGYATGCFGKWHLGTQGPHHPRARGFDTFVGFTEGHWGDAFDPWLEEDGTFVQGRGYLADVIAERTVAFIDRCRTGREARPFFCHVAFNTPHSPMDVPEDDWDRFRDRPIPQRGADGDAENLPFTRAALAMVENLDRNVGRVLAALDRHGIADETVVVFLSDNGPNSARWCDGLRGRKGSVDEGGVRSVCCLRYPGRVAAGSRVGVIAGAIDLLPTLAGLAGVAVGSPRPLDGIDLSPLLTASPKAGATARVVDRRAIVSSFNGKVSVRTATHRLDDAGRLYDMVADPGQSSDVAAKQSRVARRLTAVAEAWKRDVLTAVPPPDTERFPVGHPGSPHTELPARDGLPHGGITRSAKAPNCCHFTHWTSTDDSITWVVDVLTPGLYEAELWYTCREEDVGATIELACESSSSSRIVSNRPGGVSVTASSASSRSAIARSIGEAFDPPLNLGEDRIERRGESHDKPFRPLALGRLSLPVGQTTLTLRATQIPGDRVADVRRLVLRPTAP